MGRNKLEARAREVRTTRGMSTYHASVLLTEVLKYLEPEPGKRFIDATAGGGGHTKALAEDGASVLALDRDPEAIEHLGNLKAENIEVVESNFSHIYKVAQEFGFTGVDGILFDLGVSSRQLDTASRGFSFQKAGPLDMRMDPNIQIKASDLINNLEKRRLNEIFQRYGQEKLSLAIADAVCSARQVKPIKTTEDLSKIVKEVYGRKRLKTKMHPATKVFQALRIVVNSELLNLEEALEQTVPLLKKGGRLVVVSFHSLEDGIVKRFLKENPSFQVLTKVPIGPGTAEIAANPRARSAKLRAAQKI